MKLTITVTKETLTLSRNCRMEEAGKNCAIALAVRDIFPLAHISSKCCRPFGFTRSPSIIQLPPDAMAFIRSFDDSTPETRTKMQPISFDLVIPDWVIDRIDLSEITRALENHPNLKLQTV